MLNKVFASIGDKTKRKFMQNSYFVKLNNIYHCIYVQSVIFQNCKSL